MIISDFMSHYFEDVREKPRIQISRRTETADMKLVFTILAIFIALGTGTL